MKRNERMRTGFGAASLIMILLVLCLALMGVLSLMSARADLSLSRRHARLAQSYAQAAAEAQLTLAALDEAMCEAYRQSESATDYAKSCMNIDRTGGIAVEWMDDQNAVLRFDAGEEREIEVQIVRTAWEEVRKMRFSVTAHRLVDTKEWAQTEGLILMDMDN